MFFFLKASYENLKKEIWMWKNIQNFIFIF